MMRSAKKTYEIDMLHGAILPKLLRFAVPLTLSTMLQLLFKEVEVRRDVDLRGLRELSFLQKTVKPGQGLRVAAHIVDVFLPVDDVGVKQHRDIALLHVAVGQIHRRAAAQNEFSFHRKLLPI